MFRHKVYKSPFVPCHGPCKYWVQACLADYGNFLGPLPFPPLIQIFLLRSHACLDGGGPWPQDLHLVRVTWEMESPFSGPLELAC